jgi:hypothetical protein
MESALNLREAARLLEQVAEDLDIAGISPRLYAAAALIDQAAQELGQSGTPRLDLDD